MSLETREAWGMYRVRIMEMSVRADQGMAMGLGRPDLADLEPWVGSERLPMSYQQGVEFPLLIRILMDISIPLRALEGMGWEGILDKVRWRMEGRI